ncbi:MAG: 50S ribosomal protein L24 [bacterium]|nr:50S ribosomal protein L24 [bacterium]
MRPKVKKGDEVLVIAGKDRGRRGKVLDVDAKRGKVTVEKINEFKKHQKPGAMADVNRTARPGGIITVTMPLHISNVMVIDKSTNKPTRIGRKTVGEKNLRYGKGSGQLVDAE